MLSSKNRTKNHDNRGRESASIIFSGADGKLVNSYEEYDAHQQQAVQDEHIGLNVHAKRSSSAKATILSRGYAFFIPGGIIADTL